MLAMRREGDVLAHRHVRVERVGLEHHGKAAVGGGHGVASCRRCDLAAGDVLQPRDQPQKRGLAAARGADEDHELAVFDGQVEGGMTSTSPNDLRTLSSVMRPMPYRFAA
jgi:hypothetical protein